MSALLRQRFCPSGHAVTDAGGNVCWSWVREDNRRSIQSGGARIASLPQPYKIWIARTGSGRGRSGMIVPFRPVPETESDWGRGGERQFPRVRSRHEAETPGQSPWSQSSKGAHVRAATREGWNED